jgi:hypothetical protein
MAKVYVTRCIVKRDGKSYQKGSVIDGLTNEEIKQGLAEHWLEVVGNVDDENKGETAEVKAKPPKKGKPGNPGPETGRATLLAEAAELGIQETITDETTVEDIQRLIAEKKAQE